MTSFSVAQELASSLMLPLAGSGNVLEWEWDCEEVAVCFDGGISDSFCCSVWS